jgi:Flp pilus assembly pilin Flp
MSMLVRMMMRREDGQGTVEYVGIMLLLATVLTAVVAAASGKDFNLATTIVNEVKQAISGVGGK